MRGVPVVYIGDGRHDLRPDAHAAHGVVHRLLAVRHPEGRRLGPERPARQQSAQEIINAIISDPNSSAEEIAIAFNAQTSLDNSAGHLTAPSRRDLEIQAGHSLTDSEIRRRSPRTILDPVNIFKSH